MNAVTINHFRCLNLRSLLQSDPSGPAARKTWDADEHLLDDGIADNGVDVLHHPCDAGASLGAFALLSGSWASCQSPHLLEGQEDQGYEEPLLSQSLPWQP